jgi:4,5-dihydroxyphthalate decarboxylase
MADSSAHLTYAGNIYDRTLALMTGAVRPVGITLNYLGLSSPEIFWRMLRFQEFDASELSCANYFVLRSRGDTRFVAIPVFPSRTFRHSAVYVNTGAGIHQPADLRGKRVGCPEYGMTMAIWVRAFLQHDYGVLPGDFTWVSGGIENAGRRDRVPTQPPAGVHLEASPPDRSLSQMLEAGELDALFSPSTPSVYRTGSSSSSSSVARLFPDFPRVEADYYRRTGIFPIMHTVVLRREVYARYPWAALSLYNAFLQAKEQALHALHDTDVLGVSLAWMAAYAEQEAALTGPRLWEDGFAANRPVLEALKSYLAEQGLLEHDFALEDAFAASTLEIFRH